MLDCYSERKYLSEYIYESRDKFVIIRGLVPDSSEAICMGMSMAEEGIPGNLIIAGIT